MTTLWQWIIMVVEIFVVSPACSLKNIFVTSVKVVDTQFVGRVRCST